MGTKVLDAARRDSPRSFLDTKDSSSAAMPRSRSADWHTAALFLFYLHRKGDLQKKIQSKDVIRPLYYGEFKSEFAQAGFASASNKCSFPSLSRIICMYLEKRLILRINGVESNVLRFHLPNIETFLEIYQGKVVKPNLDTPDVNGNKKLSPRNGNASLQKTTKNARESQKFVDQRMFLKIIDKFGDNVNKIKSNEKLWCACCNKSLSTNVKMNLHCQEDGHIIRQRYQKSRKEMIAEFHSLGVQVTNFSGLEHVRTYEESLFPTAKNDSGKQYTFEVVGKDLVRGTLNLTLINYSIDQVELTNIFKIKNDFEIGTIENQDPSDSFIIMPMPFPKQLTRGASARVVVTFHVTNVGRNDFFFFFKLRKKNEFHYVMQKLCVSVLSEYTETEDQEKMASSPGGPPAQELSKPEVKSYTVESTKIVRAPTTKKKKSGGDSNAVKLKDYPMPKGLCNVLNNGFKVNANMTKGDDDLRRKLWSMYEKGLNVGNYEEYFSYLLFIEHHQMSVDILKYTLHDVPLMKTNTASHIALDVPGLAEKRPSVLRGDSIMVTVKGAKSVEYEGKVQKVEETRVLLKFSPEFMRLFISNMRVSVRFSFSRNPHNLQHRALEMAARNGLLPLICFPTKYDLYSTANPTEISWYNRNVATNARQREAVINIVNGSSKPAPYLLFGPPGTGKTVTIVEAILQVLSRDENAHVLVAAPSNAAADVVSSRILNHLPPSQLLRLYSPCREWCQVPEILQKSCNYRATSGSFEIPPVKDLLKPRVVAVTMVTSGRLVTLGIPRGHFSHIIIDECAQGLEPESLISIAGMLPEGAATTQVVLAGDPLQLGPVLRSPFAKKLGLERSMLERLMLTQELYQRDDRTNAYNPKVLTKLIINFRSHPAILNLPNRLFYQGELQPCGDRGVTYSACQWDQLPKKGIPMIFHGVEGREERDNRSPSYFNTSEIHMVVFYLKEMLTSRFSGAKLPEKEIGIISPYRRQVEKIRASLRKNNIGRDVSVASVEEFQGQERRAIIVSTVRSDPQKINLDRKFRLGFLREPKRFNVAVTRAKSLLVVVGNPHVLQADPCWGQLLVECIQMGCYRGVPFTPLTADEEGGESEGEEEEELQASIMHQFKRLSLQANDLSDVQKMIEPPWESHE
ncbi:putative helicase MOV-10 [Hetaerina americana]|uniref:putative helicase MOV-10 n=1 Tax=Hetaerina americana TaxID=62018 RepID=UPI003A7F4E08